MELSPAKTKVFNLWQQNLEFLGFTFRKVKFDYKFRSEVGWKSRKTKSMSKITILPNAKKNQAIQEKDYSHSKQY